MREKLSALGGRFVDRRTTYGRELPPQSQGSPAPGVEAFDAARPTPALQELALEAGVRSRFNIDPKVGRERFEALYSRWIEASVSGELASVCLVSRQAGTETGLVTVEISDDCGRIGLFAVAEPHRRSNLGQGLVQAHLE